MRNKLYIGFRKTLERPPGGYFWISDNVPRVPPKPRHSREDTRVFDPTRDCFNPLEGVTPARARELAELIYTIAPQGENTLTVRNGRRALRDAILRAKRLDDIPGDHEIPKEVRSEVIGMVEDVLFNPLVRRALCTATNFSFNPHSVILGRISRVELGDFDATVLALFLMSRYEGQFVVPDFGFYGRDIHTRLVREGRLIAGVNYLDELKVRAPGLRREITAIEHLELSGTTLEDAEELAKYLCIPRGTVKFNDFVKNATS